MAECTFEVAPEVLEWAIKRSGRSEDELAGIRGLGDLKRWLAGTATPTMSQAESFARATYTPFGYLALSKPPEIAPSSLPHFGEDLLGGRSIHFEDAIRMIESRQNWARGRLVEYGTDLAGVVGSARMRDDPADVAKAMRNVLGLERNDMAHIAKKAEDAGVFVAMSGTVGRKPARRLNQGEFDGFALMDAHAPFVFINLCSDMPELALAHGLAQAWFGESASFRLDDAAHVRSGAAHACYAAAAELLVPTSEMRECWDGFARSADPHGAAAKHFGVGRAAAVRRAIEAGCAAADKFGARGGPAGRRSIDIPTRVSRRLLGMVFAEVGGGMLYRDAWEIAGLNASTFDHAREEMRY